MSKKGWAVINSVEAARGNARNFDRRETRKESRQREMLETYDAQIRVRQMSSPPLCRFGEIFDKAMKKG